MNLSEFDCRLLNAWQRLRFQSESNSASKHDAFRGQLGHLHYLKKSGRLAENCYSNLFTQYASKYGEIIDDQDTNKGLNNFAEAILSLANGQRNESQEWKRSLNLKTVLQSSLWKKLKAVDPVELKTDLVADTSLEKETVLHGFSRQPDSAALSSEPVSNPKEFNGTTSRTTVTNRSEQLNEMNITIGNSATDFAEPSATTAKGVASFESNAFLGKSLKRPVDHQESKRQGLLDKARVFNKRKASDTFNDDQGHIHLQARSVEESSIYYQNFGKATDATRFPCPEFSQHREYKEERKMGYKRMDDDGSDKERTSSFVTAREQYVNDCKKKKSQPGTLSHSNYGSGKRTLGLRRGPNCKFVPPILNRNSDEESSDERQYQGYRKSTVVQGNGSGTNEQVAEMDERLKNIEPKMVELITNEIMDHGPPVTWNAIAGLEFAKNVIKEMVVWPLLRPDIFKGLRGPPKGLLLFGPPGTGKTLIGKCIASQSKATFFSISASSLTSKWVGEGEKMVRALFAVARCNLPAVIFIDEIDSLLSQRTDGEHDASRRIKTEFLVQLDGAATSSDERILVVGATNRPQELDEAARRRLVKRLYIPLPEADARRQIIHNLLAEQSYRLNEDQVEEIVRRADGYSGADMSNLCREAALGPIRSLSGADIQSISTDQVRPIVYKDFDEAFDQVRASVSQSDLNIFVDWNRRYGSGRK